MMSMAWQNGRRKEPASLKPPGQWKTSGSRTPPPWVFCLYHLSGVFPTWDHPHGTLEWLCGPPMSSSRFTASSTSSAMPFEPAHLVEDARRSAFLARAVVGHDDQQRVVEVLDLLEKAHEAPDLGIGVVELRGERLG